MKPEPKTTDLYRWGASIAFDAAYEEVTLAQRWSFKERAFLIIYDRTTTRENIQERIRTAAEQLRAELRGADPHVMLPAIPGTARDPDRVCVTCAGRSFQIKSDGPHRAWLQCLACGERQPNEQETSND